jgi:hypothetical protein
VGDYVDEIHLRVEGYEGGHPSPDTLADGSDVSEGVGDEIDRARLLAEIRAELRRDLPSYHLDERYRHTSWGAEGAVLDLVVQVGAGVISTGLAAAIVAAVRRVLGRSGYGSTEYDADQALLRAREVLAGALNCDADGLAVERFERGGPGWVASVRRGRAVFAVEVATDGAVTFRRIDGGAPAS